MSLLLRSFRRRQFDAQHEHEAHDSDQEPDVSPGPSSLHRRYSRPRRAAAHSDDDSDDDDNGDNASHDDDGPSPYHEEGNEDGLPRPNSVLPLFSSPQLDALPVYTITHAIRIIVQARTETTLTWEQLRSPQVSQFLVKPMQQQIRAHHFSSATLYALMANGLQFAKERQLFPGNAGTSATRSKVCELLAIKLLKEYPIRELIDALTYDFYPLQGVPGTMTPLTPGGKVLQSAVRTSTLEVAIRASAKHFLAHPLVVQQLEAIWSGAISFYSSADTLHRSPSPPRPVDDGGPHRQSDVTTPLLAGQPGKEGQRTRPPIIPSGRRTAILYDPRNASLFKLSRLRVPRYRQILSTCSLAVLIGLFLAVLIRRSHPITSLELVFWFWSAGFMLDELVGFTEQGFSLYLMSFWNIFDIGILLLFVVYYCMRVSGVFVIDANNWNDSAYDVLAANAILLLPRIFSILDHYQYFSQLLIAFRLMAVDLAAVFVLILISCSGFFVFFTLSQNNEDTSGGEVAYKIFQILMGFTPAAWEVWPTYNWLGRALIGLFLVMCHFVIVTILITVLTNSFMSIASNASEEHQFLFAINTITEIKNEALFSYVAPGNIFAWILMPLRYFMSLRRFVWLNRCVIKATHFPLLFCIYFYERYFLAPSMYDPTDLVENPNRGRHLVSLSDPAGRTNLFSPNIWVREGSVSGFQKDRALEEVFRRAPDVATLRTQRRNERRKTQNAIRNWMDQNDGEYTHSLHNHSTIDSRSVNEWHTRLGVNRERPRRFRHFSDARSAASDPADILSNSAFPAGAHFHDDISRRDHAVDVKDNTDADGDDELVTNDEDEDDNATNTVDHSRTSQSPKGDEIFKTPLATRFGTRAPSESDSSPPPSPPPPQQQQRIHGSPIAGLSRRRALQHNRTLSTNTILYAPQDTRSPHNSPPTPAEALQNVVSRPPLINRLSAADPSPAAAGSGRRSPRRPVYPTPSRPTQTLPPRDIVRPPADSINRSTVPNLNIPNRQPPQPRRRSSVDQDPSSELNAAMAADDTLGAVPSSFVTQMAMAMGPLGMAKSVGADRDSNRMSRLMLAKMKTLEESLGDVVKEMRVLQRSAVSTAHNSGDDDSFGRRGGSQYRVGSGSTGGSTGPPLIEVATSTPRPRRQGLRRAQTATARIGHKGGEGGQQPAGEKGFLAGAPGEFARAANKGKAKSAHVSDAEDEADEAANPDDAGFTRRGSSF